MNTPDATPSAHAPAPSAPADHGDLHRAEAILSHLLRYGVLISLLAVILGMALTFVHHPDYLSSKDALAHLMDPPRDASSAENFPTNIHAVQRALFHSQGRGIVVLGLLLLIATPVLRVAVGVVIFAFQKNRAFALISLLVLITLLTSFFLGKVE